MIISNQPQARTALGAQRVTRRRPAKVAGAALLAATTAAISLFAGAAPAHASLWTVTDNFEKPSLWQKTVVGTGSAAVISYGVAGTAPGSGNVGEISSKGGGFSSLGKTVHLTPKQYHKAQCGAQVNLRPTGVGATVNVEVINPKDWTYIGLKQVKLAAWSGWQAVNVDPWTTGPTDVVLRISVAGENSTTPHTVDIDNTLVACGY